MVVVLKTHVTWIVAPDGQYSVVDGMNPAMGTGGSGDVLAGVIAGLLGRGDSPYQAARLGVWAHQRAGRQVSRSGGWFLAEELAPAVGQILGEADGSV
jgi:NAD(P)H-hydrate epimerase